jgi:hypothetical protein
MLAAEFHYKEPYIDRFMDLDRFNAHLAYRQNYPPISALFQAFCGIEQKDAIEKPSKPIKPMKDWNEAEEAANVNEDAFEMFKRQCLLDGTPIMSRIPGR